MSTGFLVCSLTNGGWAPLGGQKMEGKRGNHISFPDSISSIGLGWQHLFIKDSAVIKQLSKQLPILGTSNSFLSCSGRPDVAKYLYCLVDAVQRLICFPWIPLQQRTHCPHCWSTVTQNKQLWMGHPSSWVAHVVSWGGPWACTTTRCLPLLYTAFSFFFHRCWSWSWGHC